MTVDELMQIWREGAGRDVWTQVRTKAVADNDAALQAWADEQLEKLPSPLQVLAANVELVTRLTGSRWFVIMYALEGGATWVEVAEALRVTQQEARGWYAAAIDRREKYVPDLHDVARARAVLGDEPPATGGERP
jgi:hypothetical protein